MSPETLFQTIEATGANCWAAGGKVNVVPLAPVPADLIEQIKRHRDALHTWLTGTGRTSPPAPKQNSATVTAISPGTGHPLPAIHDDLMRAIMAVARLDGWDQNSIDEAILFARRQIARKDCDEWQLFETYRLHAKTLLIGRSADERRQK